MVEDKILVWKFNRGSKDALRRIYEKYKDDLLGLAVTLLRDRNAAEDVVHDVFVAFAQTTGMFQLNGTLKGYLSTCVANGARDRRRSKSGRDVGLDAAKGASSDSDSPTEQAIGSEQSRRFESLLSRLAYEQREVVVLHLHHGMRFRQIASVQGVSINTVQSRYRYGLDKLRRMLNGEVTT
jgi:RNA polymerase sigma-70 factor (ECF subfamily)